MSLYILFPLYLLLTMIKGINWWFIAKKKEMTRVLVDGKMIPVTILQFQNQVVLQHKTQDKDWYVTSVVAAGKKEKTLPSWKKKISYACVKEFTADTSRQETQEVGVPMSIDESFEWKLVTLIAMSKGKGFQWVMKRHNAKWWPETHGSKFHRQIWSLWNRKPRRVMKNHPHAGHMWDERVLCKHIKIVSVISDAEETLVLVKGSVPGSYNTHVQVWLEG